MKKIRILIADDSVVIRRLVSDGFAQDPALEVVGIAANGRIALQKIPQCNPDVVTLDIEMPELDGLETLKQIRLSYPRLPVIMFSTLTERGAAATLDALSLGASDYVTKPANAGSVSNGMKQIRENLIPKIKSLCGHSPSILNPPGVSLSRSLPASVGARLQTPPRAATLTPMSVDVLAIGTSTGGPNALAELIPALPADFPVPVVIVQHMPPLFTRLLAERLDSKSGISVHEGVAGMVVQPGNAYVAPGDHHMVLQRRGAQVVLGLNQAPPENSCRPAVDVLFHSVAEVYGGHVLAVILTGMGQDGLRGCEWVRGKGGQILAQDEATSVVWGMPGFVVNAGLADRVLPLSSVAAEIVERTKSGSAVQTHPFAGRPSWMAATIR